MSPPTSTTTTPPPRISCAEPSREVPPEPEVAGVTIEPYARAGLSLAASACGAPWPPWLAPLPGVTPGDGPLPDP